MARLGLSGGAVAAAGVAPSWWHGYTQRAQGSALFVKCLIEPFEVIVTLVGYAHMTGEQDLERSSPAV